MLHIFKMQFNDISKKALGYDSCLKFDDLYFWWLSQKGMYVRDRLSQRSMPDIFGNLRTTVFSLFISKASRGMVSSQTSIEGQSIFRQKQSTFAPDFLAKYYSQDIVAFLFRIPKRSDIHSILAQTVPKILPFQ